jgi:hypothetical protein
VYRYIAGIAAEKRPPFVMPPDMRNALKAGGA